jgi:hypothetical protein
MATWDDREDMLHSMKSLEDLMYIVDLSKVDGGEEDDEKSIILYRFLEQSCLLSNYELQFIDADAIYAELDRMFKKYEEARKKQREQKNAGK